MKKITDVFYNCRFQLISLVVFLILMNIGIEELTDKKIKGSTVLFIRGIFNLSFAILIAIFNGNHIIPKHPKLQLGSFMTKGLSLLLIFSSYQYISAGSVNTLNRLEIPIITLFSLPIRKQPFSAFSLSILSFLIVGGLIFFNENIDEDPYGYALVLMGVVLISAYTLIQKKVASLENIEVIMIVSSISSIFWSGITGINYSEILGVFRSTDIILILILALINLSIFYIINDVYKKHPVNYVRFPYLIAALGTMCLEMIVEQKIFSPILIIGNISILITLTILIKLKPKSSLR